MFHQSLFRRTLSLLIIFVLSLSILAGCTPSTAGDVSTAESAETETDNEKPAEEEAEEEEPAAVESSEEETVEEVAEEEASTEEPAEGEASEESTDAAEATEAESTDATAASAPRTFTIVAEQSEARFTIDEVLMGNPKTVVGVTSMVSGDIQLDAANLAATEVGSIQIETGNFVTDSDRRNGAIRRFVLQSNSYPFILFEPTSIDGLPDGAEMGQPVEFMVTGDLTILDTTSSETFNVSVTQSSEDELSGMASAVIMYADYGVSIPNVPIVADVSEELLLELEFVAIAAE